jgi:hypothetical protein
MGAFFFVRVLMFLIEESRNTDTSFLIVINLHVYE